MNRSLLPLTACAVALAMAMAAPLAATPGDLRSIASMQNRQRVLLVFAPSLRDPRLERQRQVMARFAAGAAARDLAFVQVADGKVIGASDTADRLRQRFKVQPQRYRTLLIGKDGDTALDEGGPVDARHLAATVDAMPMRREEVRRAHAGLGRADP